MFDKFPFVKQLNKLEFGGIKGNPFIEALPEQLSKEELFKRCLKLINDYNPNSVKRLSVEEKKEAIQQLLLIRIPPPYLFRIYKDFYYSIKTSYRARELRKHEFSVVKNDESSDANIKAISNEDGDPGKGLTILGSAGTGKSSLIKMILDQFPKLIIHKDKIHGQYLQISYIKLNCLPNSNLSSLLDNFCVELDNILYNTIPNYENEVKKAKSIRGKINKFSRLIEVFNIGILILDEIQLLDFSATKESSFEAILAITNNTKISIVAIGTEDAYEKMFPNLRTARRTGSFFNLDYDILRKQYFAQACKIIWRYQWFDEYISKLPQEVGEGLYTATRGVIDHLIKIYMYMQIDYLERDIKPEINKEYVLEIAEKYYPGSMKFFKSNKLVSNLTNREGISSREIKVLSLLNRLLTLTQDNNYNDDKIINAVQIAYKRNPNASVNDITKAAYQHLKRNRSDHRYINKSNIDIDEERELLLKSVKKF